MTWKNYLPRYRLPRALTACFGCLALLMVGGGLLIFLGLPALFSYINALDPEPILDVTVGSSVTVAEVTITLVGVEIDTRVRFRTSLDDVETVAGLSRRGGILRAGRTAGWPTHLRVLAITPERDVVRFQLFHPPSE